MNTKVDTTGREIAGLLVISGSLIMIIGTFIVMLGWLPAGMLAVGATGVRFGWLIAAGTDGSGGGSDRDYEPDGPGPLYVDPDDPEGLIPRR